MPDTAAAALIERAGVPRFMYGTAWKEDRTQRLVQLALAQGFRGIDTANQRRHYHEAAVGQAIAAAIEQGLVARGDLFLQSKFTFRRGQDHRLPYDPEAPIATQVQQSLASTLAHLGTDALDSYLLHGPVQREGLTPDDWAAWKAMEAAHDAGQVRMLGVSNFSLAQLQSLCDAARITPRFVQNRCYAVHGWDREIRAFCGSRDIIYQGFSLLTANRDVLAGDALGHIAQRHGKTPSQIVFRFALDVGMVPLTGTGDAKHMQADLEVLDFQLQPDEIRQIEGAAAH